MKYISLSALVGMVMLGLVLVFFYKKDIPKETLTQRYAYPESKFVDIQGMQVHYRISGQGPTLLLLHGTGASLHTWEGWTQQLQEEAQLISVDLPAFGLTGPHPQRDYSLPAYVDFVAAFAEKMKLDSFFLAGNSLGGLIAWKYAAAHPEKVQKLILIDPSGMPRENKLPLALRLAKNPAAGFLMRKLTPKGLFRKSLREVYGNPEEVSADLINRYFELFLYPGNRQAYIDRARQPYTVDNTALQTLDVPTLIMWGGKDRWISPRQAEEFARLLPNDSLIVYPELGHVPMEEAPAATAADARAFLLE